MFGLTIEKLLIIGVIAAFVLGPQRLVPLAQQLRGLVRNLRQLTESTKVRLEEEMGPEFEDIDWRKLDPRQYDPRQIIRSALLDESDGPPTRRVRTAQDSRNDDEGNTNVP